MKYLLELGQDWPTPTPLPAPGEPLYEVDFTEAVSAREQAEQFVQAWNTFIATGELWTLILIVLIIIIVIGGIKMIRNDISEI